MRYRYNNIYDMVRTENNNVSMSDLEKVIKDLIPSQDNESYDFDNKFRELEKLIDENSNQLKSLNEEKQELLKLVDARLKTVEDKLEGLTNQNLEVIMDELESYEEKQKQFNDFICEKVDDRIDRINDLIDFINDIKAKVDTLDPENAISKDANELQEQLAHINERLAKLENNEPSVQKEVVQVETIQTEQLVQEEDDQEEVESIIDEINEDDENEEFQKKLDELLALLEEQKEENLKLSEELLKRGDLEEVEDDSTYNEN